MVNAPLKDRRFAWVLLPAAVVLCLAAWSRGAEYDEQYTLFLTAGVPRPAWPETVFPAGLAREIQGGRSGLARIGEDLRITDVHPPLYFWLVSVWRGWVGDGLFAARLFSVACAVGSLGLIGVLARRAGVSAAWAVALAVGCYGFAYTGVVARGFALAQMLLLGGMVAGRIGEARSGRGPEPGRLGSKRGPSPWTSSPGASTDTKWRDPRAIALGGWSRRARPSWWGPGQSPASPARFLLAGALFGAATLSNYLAVFVAGAALLTLAPTHRPRHTLAAALGFLAFLPADLWWFLAQRGSREGQFPPFAWLPALTRLARDGAGAILGGLPLYVEGVASPILAAVLGLTLLGLAARIALSRPPPAFVLAAMAPAAGLLGLGFVFNTTPIELRYLAFATPFVALLLAHALPPRHRAGVLAVQAAAIAGLILAPRTMQPARDAARAAAALSGPAEAAAIVLLPRGNDGVGVVGAFAIEAPPALPLLLIAADESPDHIRARLRGHRRIVLAPLAQDGASRAAAAAMRQAVAGPDWREVARRGEIAVYERTGDGG